MRGRTSADDRTMQVGNMFQLATEECVQGNAWRRADAADYEAYSGFQERRVGGSQVPRGT
jgi:hypothetical protein